MVNVARVITINHKSCVSMGNKPLVEVIKILLKHYGKPTSSISIYILVKRLANAFRKQAINIVLKLRSYCFL